MSGGTWHKGEDAGLGHVVPNAKFNIVLVTLLVLTAITVGVAQIDFGVMNIVVAMVVASIKAALVILVFMHGLYESKMLWLYIVIPFILLGIMIGGVFLDDPFRAKPQPVVVEHSAVPQPSK